MSSTRARPHFIRNAAVAALVGSAIGAVAGLWSVRDRATSASVGLSSGGHVVVSSAPAPADAASGPSGQPDLTARDGLAQAIATKGVGGPTTPVAAVPPGSAPDDGQNVVQLARALAQRPDVKALMALRDRISQRADARGDQESAATQKLLRELDRYLAEARQLRLKLDGEDLRRMQLANRPPIDR